MDALDRLHIKEPTTRGKWKSSLTQTERLPQPVFPFFHRSHSVTTLFTALSSRGSHSPGENISQLASTPTGPHRTLVALQLPRSRRSGTAWNVWKEGTNLMVRARSKKVSLLASGSAECYLRETREERPEKAEIVAQASSFRRQKNKRARETWAVKKKEVWIPGFISPSRSPFVPTLSPRFLCRTK